MAQKRISDLPEAGALDGEELLELSKLSTDVAITANTISALASDNSVNDSANGFVAAGFGVGDRVNISGFTGSGANNLHVGIITTLTAGKMTFGGTDGDVIVDDAAGEAVTIAKWISARTTAQDIADLGGGGGSVPNGGTTGQVLGKLSDADGDADWIDQSGGGGVSGSSGEIGAHRYWMLTNWAVHQRAGALDTGSIGGREMELRATVGGAAIVVAAATCSDELSGYPVTNLFDGNTATLFTSESGSNPNMIIDLGVDSEVREFSWTGRNDVYWQQSPRGFDVFFSDDGEEWSLAGRVVLPAQTAAGETTVGRLTGRLTVGGGARPWYWKPPLAADFSDDAWGGQTLQDDPDVGLQYYSQNTNLCNINGMALPGGVDWTATWHIVGSVRSQNYANVGMGFCNTAHNKFFLWSQDSRSCLHFFRYNASAFDGYEVLIAMSNIAPQWFRLRYDASTGNAHADYSYDGKMWIEDAVVHDVKTDFGGVDPDFFGPATNAEPPVSYKVAGTIDHFTFEY